MTSDDSPRRSGGSSTRLIVLLLILLVAGVAAGWDYLVARPGYEQALEKVDPLLGFQQNAAEERADSPAAAEIPISTQKDVHAALGLSPAVTETAGSYLVERYSWRRGLPWLTYDLWVIYDDDAARTLRNATSVRAEADLYYATARQPDAPARDPATADDPSAVEPSESPADAEADAAEAPADETPEPTAPDAPADDS